MSIHAVYPNQVGADETAYFAEQGCLFIKEMFTGEEIAKVRDILIAALPEDGHRASLWGFSNSIVSLCHNLSPSEAEWQLYAKPELLHIIETLTDWPDIFWHEASGTFGVAWPNQKDGTWLHLDYDRGSTGITHGEGVVHGLIYLTPIDELSARTKVIPGSHKIVRQHLLQNPDDSRNEGLCDDVEFFNFDAPICLNANPGDLLFFDDLLAHSGGGHQRNELRLTLRVDFNNGMGNLADELVKVPKPIIPTLSPIGRCLAGFEVNQQK